MESTSDTWHDRRQWARQMKKPGLRPGLPHTFDSLCFLTQISLQSQSRFNSDSCKRHQIAESVVIDPTETLRAGEQRAVGCAKSPRDGRARHLLRAILRTRYAPGEIDSVGKIATAITRAERLLASLPTLRCCACSPRRRSTTRSLLAHHVVPAMHEIPARSGSLRIFAGPKPSWSLREHGDRQ